MYAEKYVLRNVSLSMRMFLKDVLDHYPVLTTEQERDLAFQIKNGSVAEKRWAEDKLVKSNFRMAIRLAATRTGGSLEFNDLFQEACVALVEAAREYDPYKKAKFGTFAFWKIRSRFRDCFGDSLFIKGTCKLREDALRYMSGAKEAAIFFNRTPSREDIAEYLGWDLERADNASLFLRSWIVTRLDDDYSGYETFFGEEKFCSDMTENEAISEICTEHLENAVTNTLTSRERFVITRRYITPGKRSTCARLGAELGITAEGVRQIEIRALRKLRRASLEDILQEECMNAG